MLQKIIRKSEQIKTKKLKGNIYVKCAFCGKENRKEWCKSEGFTIVKCKCGLTYPNPRLSMNEINSLYNNQDISGVQDYLEIEDDNKKDFERRLNLIENFVKKKGKMLDVGCNIGTLVKVARGHGWDCLGVDVNKTAINIAKKQELNCSTRDFFKMKEKFDLIIMNDLIEHLENPKAALIKAHSLLNEDGYIYQHQGGIVLCVNLQEGNGCIGNQNNIYTYSQAKQ